MTGPLKSWSYSTLKKWQRCPRSVKYAKIDKLPEPSGPALDRGNVIHEEAERFVKEKQARLPDSLALFKKEFFKLIKNGDEVHTEEEWAFKDDWTPTGWRSKDVWVRLKLDAFYVRTSRQGRKVLYVIDYKTGKIYDEHFGQLSFYAMFAMLRPEFADVDTVIAQLWYLDIGPEATHEERFTRNELEDMKEWWTKQSYPMLHDTVFPPRPGWYCQPTKSGKWQGCAFSKCNGGPCEY